jgi:hypothetical protein
MILQKIPPDYTPDGCIIWSIIWVYLLEYHLGGSSGESSGGIIWSIIASIIWMYHLGGILSGLSTGGIIWGYNLEYHQGVCDLPQCLRIIWEEGIILGEDIIWSGRISSKMEVYHLETIDIIWSIKSIIWGKGISYGKGVHNLELQVYHLGEQEYPLELE